MAFTSNSQLEEGVTSTTVVAPEPSKTQAGRDEDEITPVNPQPSASVEGGNGNIEQMTLNTVTHNALNDGEEQKRVVSLPQQPATTTQATRWKRPENYVMALESLGESPDFVDCPWCRKRKRTKVSHINSSQTT